MDRLGTPPAANQRGRYSEKQQSNYTHGDAVEQFKTAMLDGIGYAPDSIIGDGALHRFKIDGKLNGAYVLHLDGRAAGYFQDFKQGIKQNWKLSGEFMPLSEFQKQELAKKRQADEAARQAEESAKHEASAKKAVYIWQHATPAPENDKQHSANLQNVQHATPAPENHPYLVKKSICIHGTRSGRDNTLIIPLYNESLQLVNLQFINADGTKKFLSGGQKKSCFWWIGKKSDTVLIAESFSTAASLHEHTGHQVFISFGEGNLVNVAKIVRAKNPSAEIIVCGDNDKSGVGQRAAMAAALAVGGKYIIPPIVGQDFNDMLTRGGAV